MREYEIKEEGRALRHYGDTVPLSAAHIEARERRRRIIVKFDAHANGDLMGMDMQKWLAYIFNYVDEPGSMIDALWWDIAIGNEAVYPSRVLAASLCPGVKRWRQQGLDFVRILVEETHRRRLEAFWNHRIAEVDPGEHGLAMKELNPEKAKHQDWVLKSWWWQGLWNLAVPALRSYKVAILRELAENYDFDGFQIDFSRHVPCLPVGRQWELRDNVTELMKMLRDMLLEVGEKRGRPLLLAAKVPETLEGCREDGFDVVEWTRLKLVDIFALGSRSLDVDVEAFRRITERAGIKLYPCIDDHHATDGYRYPPIEFYRGLFGNWRQQGADGVMTFNWSNASPEICSGLGVPEGPPSHRQAYLEGRESAISENKIFAVQRRGGYPWAEGYFNRNDNAPLPSLLAYDGRASEFSIRICDELSVGDNIPDEVWLHITLFGARPGDRIAVALNDVELEQGSYDFGWKDGQIFSPEPVEWHPAGDKEFYPINPAQALLRVSFRTSPQLYRTGKNTLAIGSCERLPHCLKPLQVEKIEVHTLYGRRGDR